MVDWTPEKVASLSIEQLKSLRQNAENRENKDVAALCAAELIKRAPPRPSISKNAANATHKDQIVTGFHFVCDREKGVSSNSDGTFWTGTWVVKESHAEHAARNGAYVALHASKAEPSYLQGTVKDWRRKERQREYAEGRPVKTEYGVDFLVAPTNEPYLWKGYGSGEKGYEWTDSAEQQPAV